MRCIYQAGWISVCFDQINEVSKYCCLLFSFNLYINKTSLINSKYMYDIENNFKYVHSYAFFYLYKFELSKSFFQIRF